ncbi:hypothetical protein TGPRC2_258085 [Toxoplasma gondii TgCatPRC2]|uniref:Uncharacterized protein n=1 Tax=Toxoplasma gondii TgCatPRC2 TaxID=1130821 RepID=A0A151HLK0_TOXGO|nr:hypothetical protein TGPRC2_258085 [Toxoplasma gondii TgCatPRC2]
MRNVPFILSSEVYVDEQKEWISKELGQCREPVVKGWFLDSRPRRKAVKFEVVLHQKAPGVLIPTRKVHKLLPPCSWEHIGPHRATKEASDICWKSNAAGEQ